MMHITVSTVNTNVKVHLFLVINIVFNFFCQFYHLWCRCAVYKHNLSHGISKMNGIFLSFQKLIDPVLHFLDFRLTFLCLFVNIQFINAGNHDSSRTVYVNFQSTSTFFQLFVIHIPCSYEPFFHECIFYSFIHQLMIRTSLLRQQNFRHLLKQPSLIDHLIIGSGDTYNTYDLSVQFQWQIQPLFCCLRLPVVINIVFVQFFCNDFVSSLMKLSDPVFIAAGYDDSPLIHQIHILFYEL